MVFGEWFGGVAMAGAHFIHWPHTFSKDYMTHNEDYQFI